MILFAAVLCLLLCGCAGPQSPPPETAARQMPPPLTQRYGLDCHVLSQADVRRAIPYGDGLLLISGHGELTLTQLDEALEETASVSLEGLEDPFHPSIQVGDQVSWFSPQTREMVVLDSSLEEVRRILLPPELTGTPFLSSDGHTLYYTASNALYGWDLPSGIRRRIKELSHAQDTLAGIHWEDTVLQFRQADGTTALLSAQDGSLLRTFPGDITLETRGRDYFAAFPQGFRQAMVFSQNGGQAKALLPPDLYASGTFLPALDAAVTTAYREDTLLLEACRLSTGEGLGSLTLDPIHSPIAILPWQGRILLLVFDLELGSHALLEWAPSGSDSSIRWADAYYPDAAPNQPGLTVCQAQAQALSRKYGITIRIWEDAAACQPWDYRLQPEHLYQAVFQGLETLDSLLSQYPENLLRDTAAHFDSLNLCLVRSISSADGGSLQSATGIQFLDGRDAYAVVALGPWFSQSVCHELFHLMETHILTDSTALDHWEGLNPAGFAYDLNFQTNAQRNSGVYLEGSHRAFVDTYSMSFPKEDRARIFEYAMLPGQQELFSAPILQRKLKAICQGIREAYNLNSPDPLPWEQYLA